jgi:hypothetical protein
MIVSIVRVPARTTRAQQQKKQSCNCFTILKFFLQFISQFSSFAQPQGKCLLLFFPELQSGSHSRTTRV